MVGARPECGEGSPPRGARRQWRGGPNDDEATKEAGGTMGAHPEPRGLAASSGRETAQGRELAGKGVTKTAKWAAL